MSSNPPVILATPRSARSENRLAEVWTNLFPWDDLQAKGQPERHLGLGSDIIPTLSILAAGGGPNKRLLKADVTGRLETSAVPYGFDILVGFQGVGTLFPIPNDITLYAPGMPLMFIASQVSAPNTEVRRVTNVLTGGLNPFLTLDSSLKLTYVAGDTILILPETVLAGSLPQTRRFDWVSTSSPADGVAASVTIPAAAGKVIVLGPVDAAMVAHNVNAEAAGTLQFLDGVAGTELWRQYLGVKEANGPQADRYTHPNLQLRNTLGNAFVVQFTAGAANIGQTVNIAGWFENAGGGGVT